MDVARAGVLEFWGRRGLRLREGAKVVVDALSALAVADWGWRLHFDNSHLRSAPARPSPRPGCAARKAPGSDPRAGPPRRRERAVETRSWRRWRAAEEQMRRHRRAVPPSFSVFLSLSLSGAMRRLWDGSGDANSTEARRAAASLLKKKESISSRCVLATLLLSLSGVGGGRYPASSYKKNKQKKSEL